MLTHRFSFILQLSMQSCCEYYSQDYLQGIWQPGNAPSNGVWPKKCPTMHHTSYNLRLQWQMWMSRGVNMVKSTWIQLISRLLEGWLMNIHKIKSTSWLKTKCEQEPRGITRSNFLILRSRSISQDVLHLQEFVWSISTDDGKAEALQTFLQRCAQNGPLQLRWVPCKSPQTNFI